MGQGFHRQIVEALKAAGSEFCRQGKGDHEIWCNPITDRTFSVDMSSISRHTPNAAAEGPFKTADTTTGT